MTRREYALLHAQTSSHRFAVRRAKGIVEDAVAAADSWYIALSGGKDSTCLLHLVRDRLPAAPAVISIHKWRLPETTDYLGTVDNLHYVASGSHHGTGWAFNWRDQAEAEAAYPGIRWYAQNADEENFGRPEDGCFLGLRMDENSYRKIHLRSLGVLHLSRKHGKFLCSPLAHWSTLDVWAYIHSREIAYNVAYDVMESLGIPLNRQRVGPFAVEKALGYGQLAILKRGWPALWNDYVAEHPQARQYG